LFIGTDHRLTFQVGVESFSIEVNRFNSNHQAVIAALVSGLEASRPSAPSSVHLPS